MCLFILALHRFVFIHSFADSFCFRSQCHRLCFQCVHSLCSQYNSSLPHSSHIFMTEHSAGRWLQTKRSSSRGDWEKWLRQIDESPFIQTRGPTWTIYWDKEKEKKKKKRVCGSLANSKKIEGWWDWIWCYQSSFKEKKNWGTCHMLLLYVRHILAFCVFCLIQLVCLFLLQYAGCVGTALDACHVQCFVRECRCLKLNHLERDIFGWKPTNHHNMTVLWGSHALTS